MIKTFVGRAGLFVAVLAAQPAVAQDLVVTRAATSAATAPSPVVATAAAPQSPVANTPVASADELPANAPADDYEFLGWCTGILTGHMQLYTKVKPELDNISKRWNSAEADAKSQAEQQAAGKELLSQFRHAMGTMEAASPTPISLRGQTAVQKGLATWSGVDKLDKQNQAYAWMNFGLPARCENKAAEIEKNGGKSTSKAVAMTTPAPVAKPAAPKPAAPNAKAVGLRR